MNDFYAHFDHAAVLVEAGFEFSFCGFEFRWILVRRCQMLVLFALMTRSLSGRRWRVGFTYAPCSPMRSATSTRKLSVSSGSL